MHPLATLSGSRWVLAITAVVVSLGSWGLLRLPHDGGALAALPAQAPEVQAFRAFDAQFGAQRVLQVVVEAPPTAADDAGVFAPAFLQHLAGASQSIGKLRGMAHVLSMATVMDIAADPAGGMLTGRLMESPPRSRAEAAALRSKVLSRPAVMGNLVAHDGHAVQLICSLDGKVEAAVLVPQVQAVLTEHFGNHYGLSGVPAIAATVAAAAAPLQQWGAVAAGLWCVLMALAVLPGSLRRASWRPYAALLLNTLAAPGLALAAMGAVGGTLTAPLAVVPLVGAILASALSLHALRSLRALPLPWTWRRVHACLAPTWAAGLSSAAVLAVPALWVPRGPALLAAGSGLLASFGACWILPAFGPAGFSVNSANSASSALTGAATRPPRRQAPRWLTWACLGLAVALGTQLRHMQFTNDLPTLMGGHSAPARAEILLARHFGTGAMLQVEVAGDLRDPEGLRRLQALVDTLLLTPGVGGVSYVGDAFRQANAAMDGAPRLPDSRAKAELLVSFLGSDPAAKRLMTGDAQRAVLYVNLRWASDAAAVQAAVADATGSYRKVAAPLAAAQRQESLRLRLQAAAQSQRIALQDNQIARVQAWAVRATPPALQGEPVAFGLRQFLASEESLWAVPLEDPRSASVAQAIVALGPNPAPAALQAAVLGALRSRGSSDTDTALIEDWATSVEGPLHSLWTNARADQSATAALQEAQLPTQPAAWRAAVADALSDFAAPEALIPGSLSEGEGPSSWQLQAWVHGQPILDAVLGTSMAQQWWRTLGSGCVMAWVAALILARAPRRALVVASPIFTTVLLLFGGLAALHKPLDPSTTGLLGGLLALGIMQAVHTSAHPQRDTRSMNLHAAAWAAMFTMVAMVTEPPLQRLATGIVVALVLNAAVTWLLLTTLTVRNAARTPLPQAVGGQT